MRNNKRIFVGLDLSLTATGLAIITGKGNILLTEAIHTSSNDVDVERCIFIRDRILMAIERMYQDSCKALKEDGLPLSVIIEGFAYAAPASAARIGMLHGAVLCRLRECGWPFELVAPAKLKKFVTGKGNSPKEVMIMKILKRWGVEVEDHNVADAYALARWGLESEE